MWMAIHIDKNYELKNGNIAYTRTKKTCTTRITTNVGAQSFVKTMNPTHIHITEETQNRFETVLYFFN
jgi:hypothetical protein